MARILETTVYQFNELSDSAKERARDWWRNGALDYDWWNCTVDDAKTCLALAGFTVDKVFFSGFSSQGDGAMFEGSWDASHAKPVKAMRQHAPKDTRLHAIAAQMRAIGRAQKDAAMSVKHSGHYSHEFCTTFDVDSRTPALEEKIIEASRDAMRWIYRQLEAEYDYQMSDENADETIRANEYEFTEDGRRA